MATKTMLGRSVCRAAIESPWRAPPTFLVPLRARLHTTQQFVERDPPSTISSLQSDSSLPVSKSNETSRTLPGQEDSASKPLNVTGGTRRAEATGGSMPKTAAPNPLDGRAPSKQGLQSTEQPTSRTQRAKTTESRVPEATAPEAKSSKPTVPLSESVRELLPALAQQSPHYATIHIHSRAYMVTEGDHVLLPYHMPNVNPGDILRLNRASLLGSRDFTLNGAPYVDDRVFVCRAVVMGVEAEPMRYKEKTKRRNRKIKVVKSKHRYTKIAIKELRVKDLPQVHE